MQNLLGNNPELLKSIQVRFTGHVFPGEELEVRVWVNDCKLTLEAVTRSRNTKVIQGVIITREKPHL